MQQQAMLWLEQHKADGVNLSAAELLYYQSKTGLMDLRPRRSIQAKLAGTYLAKTKGRGMEFDEVRHYQPGDDIRAIDWRVTARTGKTHTKLYREEKERPIFILTDLGAGMHFGTQFLYKSVQAAHLTALIAWAARQRGDRIGGLIFNQDQHLEFKPLTRQKAVLSLLHGLLELHKPVAQSNSNLSLDDALSRLRRLARPGSLIFLISDFAKVTEVTRQHLSALSSHCELVAHPISDPFEQALPKVNAPQQVKLTDGAQMTQVLLGDKQTEERYQERYLRHSHQVEHMLKQCRVQVLPISCALPLELQLGGKR
ncbi:DUF58 domain-containing protein [Aliiglaciecola sp. CAU 1673]|uniref:DUF58 domain-containing protein n=1 Tax=Aliiglaciecola sp. CAU 1673 TaxID=3032595 RepID=UPI0023DB3F58|nr:DUF58 domain-containing protein [Aliiglaciecola sp. CAU 1673]MDF2177107.1 DUF58 domain-containing protein [Aliiglaciecola sp. CAU 1673]